MVRKATAEKKNQGLNNKISELELFIAKLEKEKVDLENENTLLKAKILDIERKRKQDRKRLAENGL